MHIHGIKFACSSNLDFSMIWCFRARFCRAGSSRNCIFGTGSIRNVLSRVSSRTSTAICLDFLTVSSGRCAFFFPHLLDDVFGLRKVLDRARSVSRSSRTEARQPIRRYLSSANAITRRSPTRRSQPLAGIRAMGKLKKKINRVSEISKMKKKKKTHQ